MKSRRFLAVLLIVLSCLLTGSAACTTDLAQGTAGAAELEASLSAAILAEVNAARARAGLKPLTEQPALAEAARIRAREAAVCWSHTRPDGSPWYTAGTGAGAAYGENLAKGFPYAAPRRNVDSAAARQHATKVVAAWLASPSHADNILSPDFHYACISTYLDAVGTIYEAMEFAY